MYILGNYIGNEHIHIEYKELYSIKWNTKIDIDEIFIKREMSLEYEKMVMNTIQYYINKYIPKYMASMSRTPTNRENKCAYLYIGVDDNGKITGIPTINGINKSEIYKYLNIIYKNIRGIKNGISNKNILDYFINNMKMNIIDVDIDAKYNTINLDKKRKEIEMKMKKYDEKMEHYYEDMREWRETVEFYSRSLETLCNEEYTRNDFIRFCRQQKECPKHIIDMLEDKTIYISIPRGVTMRKHNKNIIEHWIAKFKDMHTNQIKISRPKKPRLKKCDALYESFLSNYKNMNGIWKGKIKYQLIKIELKMNVHPNEWIEYYQNGEWHSCMRVLEEGEPACTPL